MESFTKQFTEPVYSVTRYIYEKYFLVIKAVPYVFLALSIKYCISILGFDIVEYIPLFGNIIATNIFLFGYLIAENIREFRAGERMPGKIVSILEYFVDVSLKVKDEHNDKKALREVLRLSEKIRHWLYKKVSTEEMYEYLRSIIKLFRDYNKQNYISDKTFELVLRERNNLRLMIIEVDMMRKIAFVSAPYVIAEIFSFLIVLLLLFTKLPTLLDGMIIVGLVSFVFVYILLLIRDLDNPFSYSEEDKLTSRVNLVQLKKFEKRYKSELEE